MSQVSPERSDKKQAVRQEIKQNNSNPWGSSNEQPVRETGLKSELSPITEQKSNLADTANFSTAGKGTHSRQEAPPMPPAVN
jgi:hypothetical protein